MLVVLSNGQVLSQWDIENERAGENQHREVPLSRVEANVLRARMEHDMKKADSKK